MKIVASFKDAVLFAAQNCREWIFLGNGKSFSLPELQEIANEYDDKTPLGETDFLVVTDDGSIGLLFAHCKEPDWYFVSPEFAIVNVLHDDLRDYIEPVDGAKRVFCKQCGAELKPGSRFCEHCGAKNAPEFCTNCGERLEAGSQFCGNCGARV